MKIIIKLLLLTSVPSMNGFCQPDARHTEAIRIDPSASFGATVSDLFEEVNFIPLETTKESLFSRIGEMQVTDKYFIIYDHNGNNVLFFTKDGKFHNKADLKKANVSIIDGFSVNHRKSEIVVRSYQKGNRLLIFDFNGSFIREEKGDSIGPHFMVLDSGYVAYENPHRRKETPHFDFFISDSTGKVVKSELPYRIGRKSMDGAMPISYPFSYSPQTRQYVYSKLGDYAVHFFTHRGIIKTYQFILPADISLPQGYLTDSSMLGNRYRYLSDNPGRVYKLNRLFSLDDHLLFHLEVMGPADRDRILVYNMKNRQLFSFGKVTPDSSCFHLPIIGRGAGLLATDDKYLYVSVGAPSLDRMNKERSVQVPYNQVLSDFFSKDVRMNNPVLIQLKLKPRM